MKKILCILIASLFLLTINIGAKAQSSEQNVIIEVFTGAIYGYCPDGAVYLEEVLLDNPNVFAINIHNTDGMEFTDGEAVDDFYVSSLPVAVINRDGAAVSRGSWMSNTQDLLLEMSVVEVSFDSVRLNSGTGLLDVYLKASFTGAADGDLRFNCVLVEDHVTGSGEDYDQENNYNDEVDHEFFGAGNPIIGYSHRYVAREFLGGPWGEFESIPIMVVSGDEVTHHFSTTVPSDYNVDELSLIATVNRFDGDTEVDRKILNAERCVEFFPPSVDFNLTANTICKGETITFTNASSIDATSYYWEFEGGEPATSTLENPGEITYPHGGFYHAKLTATNVAGDNNYSVIVQVDSVNTEVSYVGNSLIATQADASYQWFTCNGAVNPIDGATSQEFGFEESGFYSVEIDNGSCVDVSACYAVTLGSVGDFGLLDYNVYPNPSSGDIKIESQEKGDLIISDLRGQQVYISTLNKGVNEFSLQLSQGLYIITISSNKGIVTKKLIIE